MSQVSINRMEKTNAESIHALSEDNKAICYRNYVDFSVYNYLQFYSIAKFHNGSHLCPLFPLIVMFLLQNMKPDFKRNFSQQPLCKEIKQ